MCVWEAFGGDLQISRCAWEACGEGFADLRCVGGVRGGFADLRFVWEVCGEDLQIYLFKVCVGWDGLQIKVCVCVCV